MLTEVHDTSGLAVLRGTGLLDTPAEEQFDRLTRLACWMLETPMAFVSFVEEDRQFFKSCVGIPEPLASRRETALADSFCKHAVASGLPLVVTDVHAHPSLNTTRAVTDLGIVAYIGIPLITSDGFCLGTFCVVDSKPRQWTERDIGLLKDLAASVITEIELRREISGHQRAEEALRHANDELDLRVGERTAELNRVNAALRAEVAERQQAQEAAYQAEANYRSIFENAVEGIFQTTPDGHYLKANPALARIYGFDSPEELVTQIADIARQLYVDPKRRTEFIRLMEEHDALSGFEAQIYRKDGSKVWISEYVRAVRDATGALVYYEGMVEDITERKQAEEALHLRDRAMEAFMQGVTITDASTPDNRIVYANQGFVRLTGYTREEVLGQNCRFLQGKNTDPAAVAEIRKATREVRACLVELLNYRKDGTPFWNALSLAPIVDDGGKVTHFVGVQTDVTPVKHLEEQFRQSQKMEAIGHLAGGVAHDFNNLLTVINGYSEILLESLPSEDSSKPLIEEIKKAGDRAASLTRQLLAFSRKQILQPRILNLNDLVPDVLKMLTRLIGEDIRLGTVLDPALKKVKVDPGQIEQVLLNLAINSRDAMPKGGKLTIETSNADLDETHKRLHPEVRPGSYAMLAVSDTGLGMDKCTQARVFEPFFTTKGPGKGTGLGLATVYGIIKQSGGYVYVYSEPGRGTTFKIYLPIFDKGSTESQPAKRRSPPPGGRETVLLVEDEGGVRALSRQVLQNHGYRVFDAGNGEEAIDVCLAQESPIDLLLTDMVMPQMGGRELAERLAVVYPDLRVLYMSGYTDDAVVRFGVLEAANEFLQKPYTMDALLRKVRDVLDKSKAAQKV